ncbi:MAG: DUF1028 domain-containing protein [Phycisphaerae bacterium]
MRSDGLSGRDGTCARSTSGSKTRRPIRCWCALAVLFCVGTPAWATWSIVLVDVETKEIAVGSATCLTGFDLRQNLPVVLVEVGAAVAQSAVDGNAVNRIRMHDQLLLGTAPDDILALLAQLDPAHQTRQYGIVDVLGRAATFTGSEDGQHASGVIGQTGSIVYAIQGNVLTGPPVVLSAEDAVINTPGDLPDKLMAAMQAARSFGGDGRCSCTVLNPTVCGSPPDSFEKAAHISFMIDARAGDTDGVCNATLGCATGDYFMNFNVANQTAEDEDPVFQAQALFDQWRLDNVGQPDAVHSTVVMDRPWIRADGQETVEMLVSIKDWQDQPTTETVFPFPVHNAESDGRTFPGPFEDLGNGVFRFTFGFASEPGVDVFDVRADGGLRPIIVLPRPTLLVVAMEDVDADGEVDLADYQLLRACATGPDQPTTPDCLDRDSDRNGHVDLNDYARLQNAFTNELCVSLEITAQPERLNLCLGQTGQVSVGFNTDPDASVQWFRDGVAIPDATDAVYTIQSAAVADEGYYAVRLTNTCGSVTSESAAVRVFESCGP